LPTTNPYARTLGHKHYETSNHLGNVLTVFTDRKIPVTSDGITIDHFDADVVNTFDYSPFGAPMNERTYRLVMKYTDSTHTNSAPAFVNGNEQLANIAKDSLSYRYGFNGKEKDDELEGLGNSYTTMDRQYDPRLGRWLSLDPIWEKYPWQSPYTGNDNKPIIRNDVNGDCATCFTGAVIGAFTEFIVQIGDQMLQGKDFEAALKVVDKNKIYASAISGAVTGAFSGGADKLAKLLTDPKYRKVVETVLELGGEYVANMIEKVSEDVLGKKFTVSTEYFKDLFIDAGESTVIGKIGTGKKVVTKEMVKEAEKVLAKEEKKLKKAAERHMSTDKAAKKVVAAKKNLVQNQTAEKVQEVVVGIKEKSLEKVADNIKNKNIKDNHSTTPPVVIPLTLVPHTNGLYATDPKGNLYHKEQGTKVFKKVGTNAKK